ncbi:antibiotic biosynthesis monooxygenase family protein [Roseivirga sp.]|uniref:antibiotic biosynthesis monooxygenase family protein n=1 Tax=Roseivirga sp. TaxID=1964215 RepID=UPI003B516CCF
MSKNSIKEIVIYRSQEGQSETFVEQGLPQLQGMASQFDGIKSHLTFQSTKEPELFLDIVEWESLEQAERAAQMMEEQMKKADPTAQIAGFGKTDFFNHFKLIS